MIYVSYDSGHIFQQKGKLQNPFHKIFYYQEVQVTAFVVLDEVSDPQYAQLWFSFQTQ